MKLEEIADGLWGAESTVRWLGQRVPTRTTLVNLGGSDLLVHSPIELGAHSKDQIDSLGTVRHLVAPSKYHHLWLGAWARAYFRVPALIAIPEE